VALEGRISVLPREISPPLQAYRSRVPATASFDEALKAALRHGGGGDGREPDLHRLRSREPARHGTMNEP
jgi:hypothetical protein